MATTRSTKPAQAYKIQRVFPIRIHASAGDVPDLFASPETTPVATFDTIPEEPLDPEDEECLDVHHVHEESDEEEESGEEPGEKEQPDTNQQQDSIFPEAPSVTTSKSLKTTLPSGGRFVSNTFSYVPSETTAPAPPAGEVNNSMSETEPQKSDVKVYKCEDEPIHVPGAIQGFGALIAIREDERGRFLVRVVSENSQSVTGLQPEALFELRCFTDLLIHSDKKEFTTRFRGLKSRDRGMRTNPDVFSLSLTSLLGAPLACFIAMHLVDESNLVICEFELKKDVFNPRHPPEDGLPEHPVQVIDSQATEEERLLSTKSKSKPLHAVQVARETARQIGSMELFHVLCEIQNQLACATTLPEIMDIIVGLVYELTSFHRVMVYRFDETAAGQVVSEIVDARASTDIYRGLHFPASDIPKQARDLYLINKIRVLYDRDQKTARLVCRTMEDAATPLDLKHSYLRAMSPIHIKYLENMGVRASMSISLTVDNKLWGLISCHSYGSGMRVSLPVRELCRALGDLASTNIEKLLYATRIKARRPLASSPPKNSPSAYIAASSGDLLNMFGADFGFLAIKGEARTIGKLFAYNEAIVLLQYIRKRAFTEIFFTQSIMKDCPDIKYAPGSGNATIAGMLVIPLALSGSDFLIFFRKGQTMEVQWAGNPYEKKKSVGPYLQPRASFRRWSEHVSGRSREWTEDQVESAIVLSTLYGRFIEVWRQKEAIVQRNRMTRLLIRNAGHEVRTPLNSIINYLEVALEEVLDERARAHLTRSLAASKSLVFQVNDLLNLTEAEESEITVNEDNVDLKSMIVEVISSLHESSARHGLTITIDDDADVPTVVRCDPSTMRQVISNLLANAIEHSSAGHVTVGLKYMNSTEANTLVEMYVQDDGRGMSETQLDGLFQEFEQVLDDDENQASGIYEEADSKDLVALGLGLATTARFVRLNCGQISISSEPDKGTKVSVKIPFRKARPDFTKTNGNDKENSLPTPPLLSPDSMHNRMNLPGILERSHSDIVLPIRSPMGKAPGYALTPGPDSLASVAQAVAMTTGTTFDHTGGNYPFPPIGTTYARVNVLIAEDNPLNSRLLETRLTRRGHDVKVTVDGRGCANVFQANPDTYDVILMDLQMPFVDGKQATKLIRAYEKANSPPVSAQVEAYGRIPIIAVSASLSELSCEDYIEAGFDGWILKPIDFTRLEAILAAIQDDGIRKKLIYPTSRWEDGGWFKFRANGGKI